MFEIHPDTQKLLDLFCDADYGQMFSYAKIRQETGVDLMEDRQRIYTVNKRLQKDHLRTLRNVRGQGYKVALPGEHRVSADERIIRSRKQVGRGLETIKATPFSLLTDEESRESSDVGARMSMIVRAFEQQSLWNRQQDRRLKRIEKRLNIDHVDEVIEGEAIEEEAA
jgi:hypothetical protein